MSEWKSLTGDSQARWDEVAPFWDDYMGAASNRFHREIVRPKTEELLDVKEGHAVLDLACGNGNFSRRLADLGAKVVAFDYSPVMIQRALARSSDYAGRIDYRVADATSAESLLELGTLQYDRAVANMALHDIADISAIPKTLHAMLKPGGVFVFSIPHPCFQPPGMRKIYETEEINGVVMTRNSIQISKYLTPEPCESIGIRGQPVPHYLFHRPLSVYMNLFMRSGFVLDGFEEPSFEPDDKAGEKFDWYEIPPAAIFRFRKQG